MRLFGRFVLVSLALLGLTTLLALGTGAWLIVRHAAPPEMADRIVLTVDLDRGVAEAEPSGPLAALRLKGAYPLRDLMSAMEAAAGDDRVTGLLVRMNAPGLSMAHAQELREAVAAFRASGKPATVYSESIGGAGNGTAAYYLAAAFGEIWLQPSGTVGLTGFAIEAPFLRGALDEWGIEPQFGARHEYKSAIETFTEKGYSAPNRESLQTLLSSWSDQVGAAVAADRRIPAEAVRAAMDIAPLTAPEALERKLVDRLAYWDEAEAAMIGGGTEPMDAGAYLPRAGDRNAEGTKIALIYGSGAVHASKDEAGPLGGVVLAADTVSKALRDAAEDEEVEAVLLRIDSPGGSYVASDTIWRAVHQTRAAGKPVVVSMGGVAASGGYFIAMAGDRIVANPGTITGSIGVFAGKLVLRDFWDRLGIHWDQVKVGENAAMWSANQPFSDKAWQRLEHYLDGVYDDFTGKVAKARGLDAAAIDAAARGRIWTGADAKRLGLVDDLGGWHAALRAVREEAGLKPGAPLRLVRFPEQKGALAELVEAARTGRLPSAAALLDAADTVVRLAETAAPLLHRMEMLQARSGELRAPLPVPTSER